MSFGVPLGIAGVGLIGGSIALRARERGIEAIGFDPNPGSAALVDASVDSLAELAQRCGTLVLAMPADATLDAIDTLKASTNAGPSLILDVASVKCVIAERTRDLTSFVPTHPIAGSERSGPTAARADLFADRAWAYVPTDARRNAAIRAFIEAMGAHPVAIGAEEHDRALALTSHLPQIVVSTLAAMLAERGAPAELAGPGLASTLRLAGSPWELWETIVMANRPALAAALCELGERLTTLGKELEAGEVGRMASYFGGARAAYQRFLRSGLEPPRD